MHLHVFIQIYVLYFLLCSVNCNRERKIVEVLDTVHRIEDMLKKEERLREITDIIRIDSTVDKLNKKLDIVISMLDHSPPYDTSRIGEPNGLMSSDLSGNLGMIDDRLSNVESSVTRVEQSTSKIDLYAAKIEEIESRTTQMKDDTNTKLRKIMNVITALYEMNKDMKVNMGSRSENMEQATTGANSGYASEFLMENLEEMERKIKEELSVLSSDLRSEITSLKMMASTFGSNCQPEDETDLEDNWMTPQGNARSAAPQRGRSVANTLDNLVENFGHQTREIREELHNGMQEIDNKLNNLTVIAISKPTCGDLQTSESIVRTQSARAIRPVQSLQDIESKRTDTCTKRARNTPNPKSCADLRKGGATCDGIYVIFPQKVRAVRVLCDMTTDGGGWTILVRRGDYGDKMTSFNKNWASYKNGFGDSEGEFWLGNDVMHLMTTEEDSMARIHLTSFDNEEITLDYSRISIGNESTNYFLKIGPPTGASASNLATNSLRYHNNRPFSTYDRKNDNLPLDCAKIYKGGWWFNGCYFGFLTGEYFKLGDKRQSHEGIIWYDWKGNSTLKAAEMMIRPRNFTTIRG